MHKKGRERPRGATLEFNDREKEAGGLFYHCYGAVAQTQASNGGKDRHR
jgi:hypothetical protein